MNYILSEWKASEFLFAEVYAHSRNLTFQALKTICSFLWLGVRFICLSTLFTLGGSVCVFSYRSAYRLWKILCCCLFLQNFNVTLKSAHQKNKIGLISFLPQDSGRPKAF